MQQQMCRCDAFGCSRMLRFAYTSIYEACEEAYVDGQPWTHWFVKRGCKAFVLAAKETNTRASLPVPQAFWHPLAVRILNLLQRGFAVA